MAITAQMVKDLREMTGAGMLDSKKALEATNGNIDEAIEFLRKKGLAGAEKKASRIAAEGVVFSANSINKNESVIVEVNSETDFVSKNEKFRNYVQDICNQALTSNNDMEAFMEEKWALDTTKTVKEELAHQISIIGENIKIRRKEKISNPNGLVCDYIHGGGRIGVLVSLDTDKVTDVIYDMGHKIAMQVASMNPKFVSSDEMNQESIEKEKEILLEQAKNESPDKPENVIKGMVEGRFKKHLKEICLIDQVFIMAEDGKQTVKDYVESIAKKENAKINLVKFVRFETGEGLEKRKDDFAAEVAKQMGN